MKKGRNIDLSHLYGMCEKLGGLWLMEYCRTPRTHFANKSVKHNVSIENITHPLRAWWGNTRCDKVGKGRSRVLGEAVVQLTFYQPELVPHRHISVLHLPFRGRKFAVGYRGRTARKSTNTTLSSADSVVWICSLRTPRFLPSPGVLDLSRR